MEVWVETQKPIAQDMYLLNVCEYSRSEYKYWAVKYEYIASKYKYLKFVLEYYSSTSTKYYNSVKYDVIFIAFRVVEEDYWLQIGFLCGHGHLVSYSITIYYLDNLNESL